MSGESEKGGAVPEIVKNAVSLFQGALPLLEKKIDLLRINPSLRDNVLWISIILAAVVGLGAYQAVKRSKKTGIPWSAIVVVLLALGLLLALINGISLGLDPLTISWSVQMLYVIVFVSLGAAIGGFVAVV